MKLEKKKALAARTLGVGKDRIIFNSQRLNEIKEAITKQDIKDLKAAGAITIKEEKGRRKLVKRRNRRRYGSIKNKRNTSKMQYIIITRKLRSYLAYLKLKKKISQEDFLKYRREIKARAFKDISHLKERIKEDKENA